MISYTTSGSTNKTEAFLTKIKSRSIFSRVDSICRQGVEALAAATPADSGLAADSWGYHISKKGPRYIITWTNSDVENGYPVAVMIQYGHATGTGGYIPGRDYINPAIRPIMNQIADQVWKEVTSV